MFLIGADFVSQLSTAVGFDPRFLLAGLLVVGAVVVLFGKKLGELTNKPAAADPIVATPTKADLIADIEAANAGAFPPSPWVAPSPPSIDLLGPEWSAAAPPKDDVAKGFEFLRGLDAIYGRLGVSRDERNKRFAAGVKLILPLQPKEEPKP